MKKPKGPKVLIIDVETAPLSMWAWGMFDQTMGLGQMQKGSYLLSFAAKWRGAPESETFYHDQRTKKNKENDKVLCQKIWKLLDEADVVIGQNSNRFDIKKINGRFLMHGMKPPSSYKKIDTLVLSKRYFGLDSHKLEYMTDKLCTKYKKLKHKKFAGFELWKQCMFNNLAAFKEMEIYNKHDVWSTEELYDKMKAWDNSVNFNLYTDGVVNVCKCGSTEFKRNGYAYTGTGKFQRYACKECNSETRDRTNLFSKSKRASLRVGTSR